LVSTSDKTLNAVNNVEVKQTNNGGGGKKGRKMVVVCDTHLTQEQLEEYPEIEIPVKQSKPVKKEKEKTTGDGDMSDFKFVVPREDPVEEDFPLMELYEPKKEDDSRLINRGAGKKGKKKDKGFLYNPNQLPSKTVDYNKIFQ
jgi:hypothetical protein